VPPAATRALAATAFGLAATSRARLGAGRLGRLAPLGLAPARLRALGLAAAHVRSPQDVAHLETIVDGHQTAVALTMLHPNVATVDPMAAATTKALLGQTAPVGTLGGYLTQMQRSGKDFARLVPATDQGGKPAQITVGDTTTTFSTIELNREDAGFVQAARSSLTGGITAVRDDSRLGAVIDQPLDEVPPPQTAGLTWVQSQGVAPQPQPYAAPGLQAAAGGLEIKVKHPGFLFGTKTKVTGPYQDGKVPIKVYNNFVRWVSVYVQYLGTGGENLSANPSASYPDSKHARALGLMPQVATVLGIPLWDTNDMSFTLEFPQGAHAARLLLCGLGSDIHGGGWRQYFPAGAYPDHIAPTDAVLVASIITGVLTIALTVFALAADVNVGGAWKIIRNDVQGDLPEELFAALVKGTLALTASEAVALSIASGGATYAYLAANGHSNLDNLWTILLSLGSLIPKLLFSPQTLKGLLDIGIKLLAYIGAQKVLNVVPVIGEVLAIVALVGDIATLAEVCAETIVSPWVIENEVTLQYKAQLSISRDPRGGTFPVTARSWRLEALVDGASSLAPLTGTINEDGKTRSDPIVLADVLAPFGGKQIKWCIVLKDAQGNQVATGASPSLRNDDPANPPTQVSFAITQLPAAIDARTRFVRAATTAYSAAAGGYTWSDKVEVGATVASKGIQEVTGVAVSTLAAVVGAVWKQGDRYYLRGTPLAQNGPTIDLRPSPREGYARRPFLLFDPFVGAADQGNHVLVEPDETTPGYHVRKVSLDPRTGALSWDPAVSHGLFTLPVSAAALHPSGHVVAIHTDSGRLGRLLPPPEATARPQLAAYTAGHGTQPGLLQSPVAVTVTVSGIVLVLEAAAVQVSAFDLLGNPVRHFGAGATEFRMALAGGGTYLDLAVDGAGQLYVLAYNGTGEAPSDYRVDVYTAEGAPLATNSPGVNLPRLAVDYWRSLYGANYSPLRELGTETAHMDSALGVLEPSISRFDPTLAAALQGT
jgi:hypothetical protein